MTYHHIVAIVPVAHLNNLGAADILNGKITDDVVQTFADAQGARGANWLNAFAGFDPAAHAAIVAARVELVSILPKIILSRLLATRPTKVAVEEDEEDCLADGLAALETRFNDNRAACRTVSHGGGAR